MKTKKLLFYIICTFILLSFLMSAKEIMADTDIESFESSFGDWPNASGNASNWLRKSGSTSSSSTGPSSAYDGSYYIYVETSSGSSYYNGDTDIVEFTVPCGQGTGTIDFYYHQYGSNQGTLYLEGYDGSWNTIWSTSINSNAWYNENQAFSGYTKLRFRNVAAGGFTGDIALDKITVEYSCVDDFPFAPTTLKTQGETNPPALATDTPIFTAVYNDTPFNDIANKYRIQVDNNSDFSSPIWDSVSTETSLQPGPTDGIDCQVDACSPDTSIPDSSLKIGKRSTCGGSYSGGPYRSLLKFDLSSFTPGTTINSASLEVYIYDYEGSNNFQFYQATSAWDETATWNTLPTYDSGNLLFSLSSNNYRTYTKKTANVTTSVQNWLNSTWDNYGWYIKGSSESDWSRDWFSSSDDGTETYRPKLIINHESSEMSDCTQGNSCSNIEYQGPSLEMDTTYYWRIKFWDDSGQEGSWSTEQATFVITGSCPESSGQITYNCIYANNFGTNTDTSKTIVGIHETSQTENISLLSISPGKTLTVGANQELIVGSLNMSGDSGSIVIIEGGSIKPGATIWYPDADQDGYQANKTNTVVAKTNPGNSVHISNATAVNDCDDNNDAVNPGAAEDCQDATDNNCNNDVDCDDASCSSKALCATCGNSFTYGGDTYTTVLIGNQCWMSEGLKIVDGNEDNTCSFTRSCYDNNTANCDIYGGLYTWFEAMCSEPACNGTGESQPECSSPAQGICPNGWHIPSHYEWTKMSRQVCADIGNTNCETEFPYDETTENYQGQETGTGEGEGSAIAGGCDLWYDHDLNNYGNCNNDFGTAGLNILPLGSANSYDLSSTQSLADPAKIWFRNLHYQHTTIAAYDRDKTSTYFVRCIKDIEQSLLRFYKDNYDVNWVDILPTNDGGWIFAGHIHDGVDWSALVIKTDATFNISWSRTYRSNNSETYSRAIAQTSDNGYILAARGLASNDPKNDPKIIKIDSNGIREWEKESNNFNYYDDLKDIVVDGDYAVLVGYDDCYKGGAVVKTNNSGTLSYDRSVRLYSNRNDDLRDIDVLSTGNYITGGYTKEYGVDDGDATLVNLNTNGTVNWVKLYNTGDSARSYTSSIQEDANGDIFFAGQTNDLGAGDYDIFIAKANASGNLQWFKTIGGLASDTIASHAMGLTDTGDLIVVGSTQDSGTSAGIVIRFSPDGTVVYQKVFDTTGEDSFNNIVINGGTMHIIGSTDFYSATANTEAILLSCNINGCSSLSDSSLTITSQTVTETNPSSSSNSFGWSSLATTEADITISRTQQF